MPRVVVVGGGIVGTMHAVEARRRGWSVVHLDRDLEPRSATVRNFGMVWISGRAPGRELDAALASRARWAELGAEVDDLGFVAAGSLTVVTGEAERACLVEVAARPDADRRRFELLDGDEARRRNPALADHVLAALWCDHDAKVEPAATLPALRRHLAGPDYRFHGGVAVRDVRPDGVRDASGTFHGGDLVVVCPGADPDGPTSELLRDAPLRRVRLQMLQTEPLGPPLPTMLADGDSLRYYPAFDTPARAGLPPPAPVVEEFHLQLLCAPRLDGSLTVGDTHEYDEPFAVGLDPRPERHLLGRLADLLRVPVPAVARRWAGVYSQCTDDRLWFRGVDAGVVSVTGPGGRGMTLSAAIGADTFAAVVDGIDSGWARPSDPPGGTTT